MPKTKLQHALDTLTTHKLRRSKQREDLLKFLIVKHGPFSVEEVHEQNKNLKFDRVTLYRCLTAFEKVGLVRRCDFGDGIARYEYAGDHDHHHHHILCKKCKKVESLDVCLPKEVLRDVGSLGYRELTHSLEFFGICPSCQKR